MAARLAGAARRRARELVHTEPADAADLLRSGVADVALRPAARRGDDLSVIPLYTEATVVVVPKDHVVTVADDEIDAADLADETLIVPLDDTLPGPTPPAPRSRAAPCQTTSDAVDLVAAGVGVLVLPQSLGRLHQRRGLTVRMVRDAPGSAVGLAWVTDRYDEFTEEFIGIVRGRTATSSRGIGAPPPTRRRREGQEAAPAARVVVETPADHQGQAPTKPRRPR